ncbi:transcriptional regulator [Thermoplasmatales archaeon ex4484_6]|nr:MAG: transcriptional regulator [Thermoplasmatales archaeon ex4484_6]RLF69149.1 MAG: ArsR family transcriptional regulator [Thermoplasmata archaeon]
MDPIHISKVLTDEYTIKILTAASRKPVSAYDLCRMYDIPVLRCFNVVKELESLGLLKLEKQIPQTNGNMRKYYGSSIKTATITIENGKLRVKLDWLGRKSGTEESVDLTENKLEILDL